MHSHFSQYRTAPWKKTSLKVGNEKMCIIYGLEIKTCDNDQIYINLNQRFYVAKKILVVRPLRAKISGNIVRVTTLQYFFRLPFTKYHISSDAIITFDVIKL